MLEKTSLGKKKAETQNLLEQFKSAINHPSLYVYQFFEYMRNDIDIQSCKTLNDNNKELIYEHQAKLIIKVQEFERICLEQVNLNNASDFQLTIEQTESNLNGAFASQAELDRINWLLSNELLKVEKVLFQDKCMFFVKAGEIDDEFVVREDDESGSDKSVTDNLEILITKIKQNNLFGLLISVEDCFFRKEAVNKK